MEIDNIYLYLSYSLILTAFLWVMIGWEIAIAGGSLAGLIVLFVEASKPDANPLYAIFGYIILAVFLLSAGDSLRRILNREKIKSRLLKLKELYQQGHILYLDALNEVKDDSQKDSWWVKVISWKDRTGSIMDEIRKGDAENWLTPSKYIPKHSLFNEDMSEKVDSLSALVEKLREYIESDAGNELKID